MTGPSSWPWSRGAGPLCRAAARRGVQIEPSRRVVLANGGVPDGHRGGEDRFWINLGRDHHP